MELWREFINGEDGQTATEYMLIISVVIIAVVAGAYVFVPQFSSAIGKLTSDIDYILDHGCGRAGSAWAKQCR